jgi:hypothetical protein
MGAAMVSTDTIHSCTSDSIAKQATSGLSCMRFLLRRGFSWDMGIVTMGARMSSQVPPYDVMWLYIYTCNMLCYVRMNNAFGVIYIHVHIYVMLCENEQCYVM